MSKKGRIFKLEAPDGEVITATYGSLCPVLSNGNSTCYNCPLYKYRYGGSDFGASCSKLLLTDPKKFYELTGFKVIAIQKGNEGSEIEADPENATHRPTRESILDDAKRCVCGDRDAQYGSPEASFEAIADLWGGYLWNKHDLGHKGMGKNFISPEDVAAMMVLFKMARVATGSYKADSWIDAAGYAACGGEIGGPRG